MPDYPVSSQSGTGMKKNNDAKVGYLTKLTQSSIFFGPVPDWIGGCRNADAGVSFLNADAQLCALANQTVGIEHC